jgi:L-2-hydroxyglutarate oxidase LhgO
MMPIDRVDVGIVGAGVVGCAVASAVARTGRSVAILDKEEKEGRGISSRNSGVIHSGLYYPPDSLKAQLCIRGQILLYEWLEAHSVGHRKTGKLVVAPDKSQDDALHQLFKNAQASGATGVSEISAAKVSELESDLPTKGGALRCENSGIVDPHDLTKSLLVDAKEHGAFLAGNAEVTACGQVPGGLALETSRGQLVAERVINSAGLFADDVAQLLGHDVPRIYPCRGDYFRVRPKGRFDHLIYPVKKYDDAGLGIHLTMDLGGTFRVGPDSEYVASKTDFSPKAHKAAAFLFAAEKLFGSMQSLQWDGCGIRPKLRAPTATDEEDFVIKAEDNGAIHLVGIESPGLTAALALAERVVGLL